jgi:1-aminocyclopropane-1-carboxylate deaminase
MALALSKSPLVELNDRIFTGKNLRVFVLRDDLIHPFISGNKWRKLKYNIEEFRTKGSKYMVTFGGAFSNHLVATAAAGKEFGFETIGIIRGEELTADSNPVLRFANDCGMKLIFVTREKYKYLREDHTMLSSELQIQNSVMNVLPEGGSNELAVKGCMEIVDDIPVEFDFIMCPSGTGATLAGISKNLKEHQQAIGIAVLKGAEFLDVPLKKFTDSGENYRLIHDYHFGGYAKSNLELEQFCLSFHKNTGIPVEPIYTGKLFYALYDLVRTDFFEPGKTIVVVHTGGIFNFSTNGILQ